MMTNFSFTSNELVLGFVIMALFIFAVITAGRLFFRAKSGTNLKEKYTKSGKSSPLGARNKYPEVDPFRFSSTVWRLSLVVVLGLTVMAFNWTVKQQQEVETYDYAELAEDIEIDVPRSAEPPPPPPPPPPPVIQEVPEGMLLEEDLDVEFVDQSVDAETAIEAPVYIEQEEKAAPPPPPPPPPPKKAEAREIFKVVEEMPRFPGCEDFAGSTEEKTQCANQKLMAFIYENIRYPDVARENGIEGTVVVTFVVDVDGSISRIETLRDIGGKCGDEAMRVIKMMNDLPEKWTPGRQRGRAVPVQFTMPVKFELKYNSNAR